jgi:hypothetical protein
MFVWLPHFQKIFNPLSLILSLKFDVLMPVKIYIVVFWVMTPCSLKDGDQYVKEACCLHIQESGSSALLRNISKHLPDFSGVTSC